MLSRDSFFSEPLNVERNPKHCKDRSLFVSVFHSNWDAESLHFCSFNIGLFRDSLSRFYFRLQNSPYFCVFKCARAVKQKVWNEAENRDFYATLYRFLYSFWEKNRLFCSLLLLNGARATWYVGEAFHAVAVQDSHQRLFDFDHTHSAAALWLEF